MGRTFAALIGRATRGTDLRPWPRLHADVEGWLRAAGGLRDGAYGLAGYWGEPGRVNLALIDIPTETAEAPTGGLCLVSLDCPAGRFPSVGAVFPPAIRLERTICDLHGMRADGNPDPRPWLDHGCWRAREGMPGAAPAGRATDYPFLPVEGESLHRIPVGPVHAGIIEPGHFRFTCSGETVVRLEERLGYVHKGIEGLMAGASLERAAHLAGRVSGDSTVAYALAFAQAVEAATQTVVPERAVWLRALMAELERIANHLGDIGAICNDAAFSIMLAHCGVLRERVLRAAALCFGHRLMMDKVIPGGVAADLTTDGRAVIEGLLAEVRARLPELAGLYDKTTSLQDRTVGTGHLRPDLARRFGCGGVIGRASGRAVDARRLPGYPPYDQLPFDIPVAEAGDVDARVRVRFAEVVKSLSLITHALARMPAGPVLAAISPSDGDQPAEGLALVEGFRGDILLWVRLRPDRTVDRCHARDPSWFQWPLLEAVIEGNIVADFPLCNKSFNCSYSGHDL